MNDCQSFLSGNLEECPWQYSDSLDYFKFKYHNVSVYQINGEKNVSNNIINKMHDSENKKVLKQILRLEEEPADLKSQQKVPSSQNKQI